MMSNCKFLKCAIELIKLRKINPFLEVHNDRLHFNTLSYHKVNNFTQYEYTNVVELSMIILMPDFGSQEFKFNIPLDVYFISSLS